MKEFLARLDILRARFDTLSLRERALAGLTVLTVLYMFWNGVVMQSIHSRQQQINIEISSLNNELNKLDKIIEDAYEQQRLAMPEALQEKIQNLNADLNNLEQQQQSLVVDFVHPKEMAAVLKDLIEKEPGLTLTKVSNMGSMALDLGRKSGDKDAAGDKEKAQAKGPQIYKHGLVLEFQGDYNSTLRYFKKLESLRWKFYWDFTGYKVLDYPQAKIRVVLHTLSLNNGWMGV